jgi:Zn-dependent peptidase ImmA (M78 family)
MAFASRHGGDAATTAEARCDGFAVLFLVDTAEAREAVEECDLAVRSLAQLLNVPQRFVELAATCSP